jgi:hypothetical protein
MSKPIFRPEKSKEVLKGWHVHCCKFRDIHDQAARRMDNYRYLLGIPGVILSAAVGTSVISNLEGTVEWGIYLVGLLAIASASLAGIQTSFNYPERAEKHRITGVKYKAIIREIEDNFSEIKEHEHPTGEERSIVKVKINGKEIDVHDYLDDLKNRLDTLEVEAPVAPQRIYDRIDNCYKKNARFVKTVEELLGISS